LQYADQFQIQADTRAFGNTKNAAECGGIMKGSFSITMLADNVGSDPSEQTGIESGETDVPVVYTFSGCHTCRLRPKKSTVQIRIGALQ